MKKRILLLCFALSAFRLPLLSDVDTETTALLSFDRFQLKQELKDDTVMLKQPGAPDMTLLVNNEYELKCRARGLGFRVKTWMDDLLFEGEIKGSRIYGKTKEKAFNEFSTLDGAVHMKEQIGPESNKNGGHFYHYHLKMGYRFHLSSKVSFSPFIQWEYQVLKNKLPQNFEARRIDEVPSKGKAKMYWSTPSIGFELPFHVTEAFSLSFKTFYGPSLFKQSLSKVEYQYRNTMLFNKKWGRAFGVDLKGVYQEREWMLDVGYGFSRFSVKPNGSSMFFGQNNSSSISTEQKQGKIKQKNHTLSFGLSYLF